MAAIVPPPKKYPAANDVIELVPEPANGLVLSVRIVLLVFGAMMWLLGRHKMRAAAQKSGAGPSNAPRH